MTDNYHAAKFDKDKQRPDLLLVGCPAAIADMVAVLTSGAVKYSAHSWRNVPNAQERYRAAMLRHVLAFCSGEDTDPESGHPHLAHVAVNAAFLLEFRAADRGVLSAVASRRALEEEQVAATAAKRRYLEDAARTDARRVIADMDAEAESEDYDVDDYGDEN